MKPFVVAAGVSLTCGSFAQAGQIVIANRTLVSSPVVQMLDFYANGDVAACVQTADGSRLYTLGRNGAVKSLRYLPGVDVNQMQVHTNGNVYVAGSVGTGDTRDAYVGCFNAAGVGQWAKLIDTNGVNKQDSFIDMDISPNGDVVVAGYSVPVATYYGTCFAFNPTTGVQKFKVVRSDVYVGRDIAISSDGFIHIADSNFYWRLTPTGQTVTRVDMPVDVTLEEIAAGNSHVYLVGRRNIGPRSVPWIQGRLSTGPELWSRDDPAATGDPAPSRTDGYFRVEVDVSDYAHARGGVATATVWNSRQVRWSTAGNATLQISRPPYAGTSVIAQVFGLDRYNEIYAADYFSLTGDPSNQLELTRYAPYPLAYRWREVVDDSPAAVPASASAIAVHSPSGDVVLLLSDGGVSRFVTYRQQSAPVDDAYSVPTAGPFNSPNSVLANDRYREGAVLSLVSPPTKGVLNLNVNSGTFTYTRNPMVSGQDSFVYRLKKAGVVGTAAKVRLNLQ